MGAIEQSDVTKSIYSILIERGCLMSFFLLYNTF